MKKKLLILIPINLIIVAFICYFVIFAISFSKPDIQYNYTIGAIYGDLDNSYYSTLQNEINNLLEENNCLIINRDSKNDISLQNQQIIDLVNMGIDALLITPIDSFKISKTLEIAKDKGLSIVIIDNPVAREDLVDCTIHSDNETAGNLQGVYLKNNLSNSNIIVLNDERSIASENRILGFEKIINSFSGAKIIDTINTLGSSEQAMIAIENEIDKNTKFNTIFAVNDICALGAYAALEKHGITDIKILSIDGSPKGKLMVMNNHFFSTVLQYPNIIGEKSAIAILKILDGKKIEKDITVPVKLITKNTIRSYDLEKWE